jgi:nitroreductase
MEFQEVVQRRHMVRTFAAEPVPKDVLDRILANAVRGPSAGFSQGWTDRDEARWPVPFWHIDTGMAALLILLTVTDENLGAVYFGIVPPAVPKFRAAFGVPDDQEPIGAIAVGYDAEPRARDLSSRRRPLDQLVHHGTW